jgi:hypothetical protein
LLPIIAFDAYCARVYSVRGVGTAGFWVLPLLGLWAKKLAGYDAPRPNAVWHVVTAAMVVMTVLAAFLLAPRLA